MALKAHYSGMGFFEFTNGKIRKQEAIFSSHEMDSMVTKRVGSWRKLKLKRIVQVPCKSRVIQKTGIDRIPARGCEER